MCARSEAGSDGFNVGCHLDGERTWLMLVPGNGGGIVLPFAVPLHIDGKLFACQSPVSVWALVDGPKCLDPLPTCPEGHICSCLTGKPI